MDNLITMAHTAGNIAYAITAKRYDLGGEVASDAYKLAVQIVLMAHQPQAQTPPPSWTARELRVWLDRLEARQ
jgi:hypothetical protein